MSGLAEERTDRSPGRYPRLTARMTTETIVHSTVVSNTTDYRSVRRPANMAPSRRKEGRDDVLTNRVTSAHMPVDCDVTRRDVTRGAGGAGGRWTISGPLAGTGRVRVMRLNVLSTADVDAPSLPLKDSPHSSILVDRRIWKLDTPCYFASPLSAGLIFKLPPGGLRGADIAFLLAVMFMIFKNTTKVQILNFIPAMRGTYPSPYLTLPPASAPATPHRAAFCQIIFRSIHLLPAQVGAAATT